MEDIAISGDILFHIPHMGGTSCHFFYLLRIDDEPRNTCVQDSALDAIGDIGSKTFTCNMRPKHRKDK